MFPIALICAVQPEADAGDSSEIRWMRDDIREFISFLRFFSVYLCYPVLQRTYLPK